MATTTVSLEGTLELRDALTMLARLKRITVGKLVATAVMGMYGNELKEICSFFDQRDTQKDQMMHDTRKVESN